MNTLIISDLHLGNGGPYDVFEGHEALPALLDHLSFSPVRVIVNGDGVDFLMNEDPLELDEARAVGQAKKIAQHPPSAAVFQAFGRVLERGGEVTIRLGNHDVELAFAAVQAVFRGALQQPAQVAGKLVFAPGDAPEILPLGGARILVTHGEQDDPWNKVDYQKLRAGDKQYTYAPGSVLVKKVLNPGTAQHGMRFLSLLKPDFQGAALSALAVDPRVAKQIFKGATLEMLAQLFQRKQTGATFDVESAPPPQATVFGGAPPATNGAGFSAAEADRRLDLAKLNDAECEAMESLLDGTLAENFGDDEEGSLLGRAALKIGRASLALYGKLQHTLAGSDGDAYFALEPTTDEWAEARRLADKFGAGAVVMGHTHAARWKEEGALVYANTGTWIGLMQLPPSNAVDEQWAEYLSELRQNKGLDPARQKLARIRTRFTAVLASAEEGGGAALSLVEWDGAAMKTLGQSRIPASA